MKGQPDRCLEERNKECMGRNEHRNWQTYKSREGMLEHRVTKHGSYRAKMNDKTRI
jgi:hypothetical protein